MGFEQAAHSIASDLDDLGLSYALVGGFAVSIRTDPRFTQDIDLVVSITDDDAAEIAVNRLVARGYSILATVEHETQGRVGHLIVLKLLARDDATRPQDSADLSALLEVADEDELSLARRVADLVAERGYARGRDLEADLDALLAEHTG